MYRGQRILHTASMGDVLRVGGSPPGDDQLLLQLPDLLLGVKPVQSCSVKTLSIPMSSCSST